jgi:phasin family protein
MPSQFTDELSENQRAALEAIKEWGEINAVVIERLMEQNRAALTTFLEAGTEHLQVLTGAKDYKAFMNSQTEFVKSTGEKLLAYGQETNEILNEARQRLASWLEKGFENVARTVPGTVRKAA